MTEPAKSAPAKSKPRRWIHWLVTAMVFVAAYAWMTRGNASPLMGEPAPDLTLAVAAGAEPGGPTKVTLSDMGGQVVVLDFWASWCGACRRATPILNDLNQEFAEQGVAFYAVNVEPIDRQRLQAAHAAFGTQFPTLHDRAGTVQRARCGSVGQFPRHSISQNRSRLTGPSPAVSFAGRAGLMV
jgi:thiol-disulfide isomerase/thioredoxin